MSDTDRVSLPTARRVRTYPPRHNHDLWRSEYEVSALSFDPRNPGRPYSYYGTGVTEDEAIADLHRREAADTWEPVNGK